MKPDQTFNDRMRRTGFGSLGPSQDAFVSRNSNLPHGTFESRWERFGDRIVGCGAILGLIALAIALWKDWL